MTPEQQHLLDEHNRELLARLQGPQDPFAPYTEDEIKEFQGSQAPEPGLIPSVKAAIAKGFHVFPLAVKSKIPPQGSQGFKDSKSPDDPQVLEPWNQDPNLNIGINLGASDLCVLDFDQGEDKIPQWVKEVRTLKVRTAKGVHVYFRGARKTTKLYIDGSVIGDLKSVGGYVLAAGSAHPDGPTYTIIDDSPIVPVPDQVSELVHHDSGVDASVDGPPIPYGMHDTELTRIAGLLRNAGFTAEKIEEHLIDVCEKRCDGYGTDYREMCRKIAKSIGKKPIELVGQLVFPEHKPIMSEDQVSLELSDENQIPDFNESVITGIYRDIVDLAVGGTTIPPQFAFLAAKVYLGARMAGKVTFQGLDCDSSYYAAVIGVTGTSKGESWRRTFEKVLNPPELTNMMPHLKVIHSADSGAGLKDAFFEPPIDLPMVCYIDEVTTLGHKAGEKKNPEILDQVIELADSHRISRVKAKHGKEKSVKTHDNARLSIYVCGQDGPAFMGAFAGRTKLGLFDRLYPEFSGPIEAGYLNEIKQSDIVNLHMKISQLQFSGRMTMSPEAESKIEGFWKTQPSDIRRKIRFKKYLMLDMYMAAFGRGVRQAELEDVDVAIKIFTRQMVIRQVCFTGEVPDRVGFYTGKIKTVVEAMRKQLNNGKSVAQVARSIRDFQTITHAFRDNELHTFERAWKSMSEHVKQIMVQAGNGQKYPKWVPMPYEHEMWAMPES